MTDRDTQVEAEDRDRAIGEADPGGDGYNEEAGYVEDEAVADRDSSGETSGVSKVGADGADGKED